MWHSEAYLKLKQSGSGSGGRAITIDTRRFEVQIQSEVHFKATLIQC